MSGAPCVDVTEGMGAFSLAAMGLVRLGTAYVGFRTASKPIDGSIMIECTEGYHKERRWASSPGVHNFKLGRAPEQDIPIPNTMQTISSEHLVFENEPHVGWTVTDTVSTTRGMRSTRATFLCRLPPPHHHTSHHPLSPPCPPPPYPRPPPYPPPPPPPPQSTYGTTLYDDWPLKKNSRVLVVPGMQISVGKYADKMTFVVKVHKASLL